MKYIMSTMAVLVALSATSTAANAQQTNLAAIPSKPIPLLQAGLNLKAVQRCQNLPGEGVTLSVYSASADGTTGMASMQIKCWGRAWMLDDLVYIGSITIAGPDVTIAFQPRRATGLGGTLKGTWTMEAGKLALHFGQSTLLRETALGSKELTFR